ncbi:aldehyde dehydrogenase family protein [Actinosynnema sp. NPDC023587]|uniref:aldehyde dehydrogenase family protein n=1 Tax=Actinosynnema sp. NPDC023587 TaxID=3154695 RepID=UPI0033C5D78E
MPALMPLDALGPRGPYRTQNTERVDDVSGRPVAELSLVPPLYVHRTMAALRRAEPLPPGRLRAVLAEAGELFADGVVDGVSAEAYCRTVARVSGLPIPVVRSAAAQLGAHAAGAADTAGLARPVGAVADWRDETTRKGSGVWVRRGEVLAVNAPANTPSVHAAWLDAVAFGYRVAIRPSRREPFTPHRLVSALRAAGLGDDRLVLLPGEHRTADVMISDADLAVAFGGDDVVRGYGTGVLSQGPGRSKVLLTADADRTSFLDTVVESVAGQAGTGCVNATAVFVEGDPGPVAERIAARLAELPVLPPEDDRAALPVRPVAEAKALDDFLRDRADGAKCLLGQHGIVAELGDGSAVLTPAVHLLDRADAPQTRVELGFPCVWVAPWSRAVGIAPLRDTLVLTAFTDDEGLLDGLLREPTIANVHVGAYPTNWKRPGLPHDGYLGEFLMRGKTFVR